FNLCINPDWVEKIKKKDQFIFNLSIRPGVNISSLLINNGTEYGSKASPRLGLEAEFVLPFNKNKWSILVEPTYRDYQNEATVSPLDWVAPSSLKVDYPSIEFAIGIRHYIFLNDKSKIFVTGYMLNDMEMDAMVSAPRDLTINPLSNFAGGFGYKYNGKVSLEFRYDGYRELLRLNGIQSKFRNISLILGYTFL
ncbi:MAG: hypothetical protein KAJ23_12855, partial [Maribacter sp.]|nr:hypothetical protein [Maribacter sp.]